MKFRRTLAVAVVAVLVGLARPSAALQPGARAEDYTETLWPAVPRGSAVSALVRSPSGALWAGTSEGLLRLEGPRTTSYDPNRVPGIAERNILALLEAPDGALWIGTRDRGLIRLRGSARTSWRRHEALPDDDIHALARTSDGAIWMAAGTSIVRLTPGAARGEPLRAGLPWSRMQALTVDPSGTVWVGTTAGALRWDAGTGSWHLESPAPAAHVQTLWADPDGSLWVGTDNGLWQRERTGAWRVFHAEASPDPEISAILRDRTGHLWVGTRQGTLAWLQGDRLRAFPLAHDRCERSIQALAEDAEGGLWLGTACGLYRLEERAVRLMGKADGLPADNLLGLNGSDDGTVWVSTRGAGLARIAPGRRQAEPVACPAGLSCAS